MLFYIAEPIDLGSIDQRFVKAVMRWINQNGHSYYSPKSAFGLSGPTDSYVSRINEEALDLADGVVAFLVGGVQTIGVPAEIQFARDKGMPVLVITDLVATSWFVKGWESDPAVRVVHPNGKYDGQYGIEDPASLVWFVTYADYYRSRSRMDGSDAQSWGVEELVFEATEDDMSEPMLPTRGHADDAGFDLYTSRDTVIQPGEFVDVPCGVSVDLPDGVWGLVTGRSSTLRVRGLHVANGIIDTGYTGPLFAGCQNLGDEPVVIKRGERVAQVVLLPSLAGGYAAVWGKTRSKERGTDGFGSTGL